MSSNITPLIESQITEYLRGASPLFSAFMELYYSYASERNNSLGVIQYHTDNVDVDLTTLEYVDKFYAMYGPDLPIDIAIDKRNFIKILNSVYDAKGTEKALVLIFKTLYNEDITVSYPNDKILIASGGKWSGESFITLSTRLGHLENDINTIYASNIFGDFYIESTRIEYVSDILVRIYYKSFNQLRLVDDQLVTVLNNGLDIFIGQLVKSPSTLTVTIPGNNWLRGQVINITGTIKNTIARITSVNSSGGIVSAEILDYGYGHTPDQETVISPYPNKPVGSIVEATSILVSILPNVYQHTISIVDYIDGVYENVIGISDANSPNQYFLEDYSTGYSGSVVMVSSSTPSEAISEIENAGITIEEWLASRSTFVYNTSNIVKMKGYYIDESGQLSNQEIRLQDNYFYQAFSYVIQTSRDINDYRNVLRITHPAGTKLFANLDKHASYDVVTSSSRSISNDVIYLLDTATTIDVYLLEMMKTFSDSVSPIDYRVSLFTKSLVDSIAPTDSLNYKNFTKLVVDSASTNDQTNIETYKVISDSVNPSEYKEIIFTKFIDDSASTTDSTVLSNIKYINDSATATSNDVATLNISTYDLENYFGENYVGANLELSIG